MSQNSIAPFSNGHRTGTIPSLQLQSAQNSSSPYTAINFGATNFQQNQQNFSNNETNQWVFSLSDFWKVFLKKYFEILQGFKIVSIESNYAIYK